jgi:hypothetical protein
MKDNSLQKATKVTKNTHQKTGIINNLEFSPVLRSLRLLLLKIRPSQKRPMGMKNNPDHKRVGKESCLPAEALAQAGESCLPAEASAQAGESCQKIFTTDEHR